MSSPTTPDLVLLSLLSEKPMHGYEANAELERRCIRDWAAISRPQIYYSLEKLARCGLLKAGKSSDASGGPERARLPLRRPEGSRRAHPRSGFAALDRGARASTVFDVAGAIVALVARCL